MRPDFRRLWAAHSISTFGDQLTLVALPIAAYEETSSALGVGVVASAEAVTAVVFGLAAGALADRLPYRRVLVQTDLGRVGLLLALVLALRAPNGGFAALVIGAIGLGMVRVVHDAAANASIPVLVDEADLLAANGRLQASESVATAIGPALAGGLVALGGAALAFGLDAATFLLSAAALVTLRRLDEVPPIDDGVEHGWPRRLLRDMGEGLHHLRADRVMRRIIVLVAAMNLVAVAAEAQFIPYAREVLEIGALGIGAYFALGGTAAVITALVVGSSTAASGWAVTFGLGLFAAGITLAGVVPSFVTVAMAYVCAGIGSVLVSTHQTAFRQRRFPVRLQGRVSMAVRGVILAPMPIGLVLGGWLADSAGPELLFIATGGAGLLVAAWGVAAGVPSLRVGST